MIYLSGDTHRRVDIKKLLPENFDYSKVTRDDYLIILGDFGAIWYGEKDEGLLNFYNNLPLQVCWIDGNHENFDLLEKYPIEYWHNGKIHRIKDNIVHLMRGQVFEIENKTFFTFGGGTSIDRAMRVAHESWWPNELPTEEEMAEGIHNLNLYNWKVDYVLTHCAPYSLLKKLVPQANGDILNFYLHDIDKQLTYTHWYLGHYHKDIDIDNYSILYNNIHTIK